MKRQNIQKIQNALAERELDAILLLSPYNIRYATGLGIDDSAALIGRSCAFLFTDSRYIEAAQAGGGDFLDIVLCTHEKPLLQAVGETAGKTAFCKIGGEENYLPHGKWLKIEEKIGFPLIAAEEMMTALRAVKEPWEIEQIVAAQRIAEQALQELLKQICPGMTEREIAAELTYRMLLHGGDGNSFDPICVSGKKSSMPHGVPGDNVVREGDFLTMDFGCLKNGYCSDMTRTVAIGSATDEMREVYDTVLHAQLAGIAAARAGVSGAEIHSIGAKVIADAGYGDYFGHGFGHSLGLEIHEAPYVSLRNKKPLPAGAVVTAEPGIYIPGKFGVRIEDMIVITDSGCEVLTKAPKDLLIIG